MPASSAAGNNCRLKRCGTTRNYCSNWKVCGAILFGLKKNTDLDWKNFWCWSTKWKGKFHMLHRNEIIRSCSEYLGNMIHFGSLEKIVCFFFLWRWGLFCNFSQKIVRKTTVFWPQNSRRYLHNNNNNNNNVTVRGRKRETWDPWWLVVTRS